jgi:hypothetical protein
MLNLGMGKDGFHRSDVLEISLRGSLPWNPGNLNDQVKKHADLDVTDLGKGFVKQPDLLSSNQPLAETHLSE